MTTQKNKALQTKNQTIKKAKPKSQVKKKLSPAAQKLKPTELAFAKEYAANGRNGTKALLAVRPELTPKRARVKASSMISTNPDIVEVVQEEEISLKEALLQQGITPSKIATKVNVLLDAEKKIYRNNMKTGKIEEVGSEPHHEAIDKGLKHATAIFGVIDPGSSPSLNTYNFFINPVTRKKIEEVEDDIKQSLFEALPKD